MSHQASLLLFAFCAVIALVVLIARFRFHPFLSLTLVSVAIGLRSGMNLPAIAKTFQEGVGNTLGFLGVVVGLGMMLGKMLSESGGAHVVAGNFTRLLGVRRLPWAMLAVAFVVGVPVLFSVGLVLLIPIVYALARETNTPLLRVAVPLLAGLSVSQGFLPPHPGPMLAIEQVGADVGRTILYGALVGIPTAIVAGPLFGALVGSKLKVSLPAERGAPAPRELEQLSRAELELRVPPAHPPPGFGVTLLTILLPVLLMLLSSLAGLLLPKENLWRVWAEFAGSPIIAMLLAVLVSIYTFGYSRGFNGKQILKFLEDCLGPAAAILLVVGAGGGLSKMLERGGVGAAIADIVEHAKVSPLLLGWMVAAAIRVAVGSATVAITMAAAIMAPVAANTPGLNRELLVLAMGAGSLFLSHVNDGGFWFVKECLNLTVPQTFKTWTVLETCVGLVGLGLVMLLARFV